MLAKKQLGAKLLNSPEGAAPGLLVGTGRWRFHMPLIPLAARKGLEPLTFGLGNRCSVLLSYRAGLGVSDAMGRGAAPSPSTKNARRMSRAS